MPAAYMWVESPQAACEFYTFLQKLLPSTLRIISVPSPPLGNVRRAEKGAGRKKHVCKKVSHNINLLIFAYINVFT